MGLIPFAGDDVLYPWILGNVNYKCNALIFNACPRRNKMEAGWVWPNRTPVATANEMDSQQPPPELKLGMPSNLNLLSNKLWMECLKRLQNCEERIQSSARVVLDWVL